MRKLFGALAVVTMMLAATTFAFWRDRDAERARADALQARVTALESRQPATPISPPSGIVAPGPATDAPVPQAADAIRAEAHIDADDYDEYVVLRRRMLRDPKYYETARASMRPNFALRRAELIRVLGITAAQADGIVDYWIDRQLRSEARALPIPTTEQERLQLQELVAREQRDDEEKLRAILGAQLFPKMQEYIASHPSRNRVAQLRSRLADGSDALRDDQVEPLIAALHTEQTRLEQEAQDFVATLEPDANKDAQRRAQQRMDDIHKASYRRILSSAASILSSKQLAELEAIERADLDVMQAQSALRQMEERAGGK